MIYSDDNDSRVHIKECNTGQSKNNKGNKKRTNHADLIMLGKLSSLQDNH